MGYNKNKPIVKVEPEVKEAEKKEEKKEKAKPASTKKSTPKAKGKTKGSKSGARKKESDPRIRIAIGAFIMLLSVYILLSTFSYIIDYKITGNFGDTIGKFLSEYTFGIGSFYLIILLALAGSLLTFKGPKIAIKTICKYCLVFLMWTPLFLATILPQSMEKFHGLVGEKLHELLEPYIMNIGIYILLFFFLFMYIIYTFDIKMPTINSRKKDEETEDEDDSDENGDGDGDENEDEDEKKGRILPFIKGDKEIKDEVEIEDEVKIDEEEIKTINYIEDIEDDYEDDEEDYEDVEITVVHKGNQSEIEEEEGFEVVTPTQPINEVKDNGDINADDIDMEITKPVEEKQAIEIGEHFGLDTNFDPKLELSNFKFPPLDLLKEYGDGTSSVDKEELEANKKRIVDTLANYNIAIDKIKATIGPTVTLYEIIPAAGVRIAKIKNLQDDIALCLSAIGIRIIAPIPGKGTVGIEVPNQKPQTVSMKSVLGSERFQKCGYELPFGVGKTISNESYVADLAKMPHILMAGATGQGKSVVINAII